MQLERASGGRLVAPRQPRHGGRVYTPDDVMRCSWGGLDLGMGLDSSEQRPWGSDLRDFFYPGQLLAQWPFYPPWIVTDDTVVESPNTFNAADWSQLVGVTVPGANTIRETATTDLHWLGQVLDATVGPVVSASCEFKADGRDICALRLYGGALDAYATFLLGAGTVGTVTNQCTSAITPLGGGVFRGTIYPTAAASIGNMSLRVMSRAADNLASYAGDVTKGIKVYNAQINQTSIVTALNVYGDEMLALYGDRFDLTNPTKASQFVYSPTAWGGLLPGAILSGANWLAADALAARFQGDDKPIWSAFAAHLSAVENTRLYAVADWNSSSYYHDVAIRNTNNMTSRRKAGGVAQVDGSANFAERSIFADRWEADTYWAWKNGVADSVGVAMGSTSLVSVDRYTVGARRVASIIDSHSTGVIREGATGMSATDAQMLAASNYFRARNPL